MTELLPKDIPPENLKEIQGTIDFAKKYGELGEIAITKDDDGNTTQVTIPTDLGAETIHIIDRSKA